MYRQVAAEGLLARVAGADRAGVIFGDLTEMAATRTKSWFWINYLRTIVALGWRTPAAALAGVLAVKYGRQGLGSLFYRFHLSVAWFNDNRRWLQQHPYQAHLASFSWVVSVSAVFTLWILLPYAAMRFGVRSRLTYLAATLFVLALPVYTSRPQIYQFTGLACALVIVAALASPRWRKEMIFLVANYPIFRIAFYVCITDPLGIFHPHHTLFPMQLFGMRIDDPVAIAITILLVPYLYRWLIQPRTRKVVHV